MRVMCALIPYEPGPTFTPSSRYTTHISGFGCQYRMTLESLGLYGRSRLRAEYDGQGCWGVELLDPQFILAGLG